MALKPLTEKPRKKKQEEKPTIYLNCLLKKENQENAERRINANELTIGRLIATNYRPPAVARAARTGPGRGTPDSPGA